MLCWRERRITQSTLAFIIVYCIELLADARDIVYRGPRISHNIFILVNNILYIRLMNKLLSSKVLLNPFISFCVKQYQTSIYPHNTIFAFIILVRLAGLIWPFNVSRTWSYYYYILRPCSRKLKNIYLLFSLSFTEESVNITNCSWPFTSDVTSKHAGWGQTTRWHN